MARTSPVSLIYTMFPRDHYQSLFWWGIIILGKKTPAGWHFDWHEDKSSIKNTVVFVKVELSCLTMILTNKSIPCGYVNRCS